MITIKSSYLGELRTEAQHLQSGTKLITDAPTDNNGKGEAFSPTDLVCAALGSCMMTIMGIAANKAQIDLQGLELEITKYMAASPRAIRRIDVRLKFPPLELTPEQRQTLIQAAETCPVALSLHPNIEQKLEFVF